MEWPKKSRIFRLGDETARFARKLEKQVHNGQAGCNTSMIRVAGRPAGSCGET